MTKSCGRWEKIGNLGRGGQGEVWKVREVTKPSGEIFAESRAADFVLSSTKNS